MASRLAAQVAAAAGSRPAVVAAAASRVATGSLPPKVNELEARTVAEVAGAGAVAPANLDRSAAEGLGHDGGEAGGDVLEVADEGGDLRAGRFAVGAQLGAGLDAEVADPAEGGLAVEVAVVGGEAGVGMADPHGGIVDAGVAGGGDHAGQVLGGDGRGASRRRPGAGLDELDGGDGDGRGATYAGGIARAAGHALGW
jgi:hypothetical protein